MGKLIPGEEGHMSAAEKWASAQDHSLTAITEEVDWFFFPFNEAGNRHECQASIMHNHAPIIINMIKATLKHMNEDHFYMGQR